MSKMLWRMLLAQSALALLGATAATAPDTTSYDYIVVGGGTAGLVIANRLSEDPAVTVAVIEAGGSVFNNPNVLNTTAYGLSLNTSIDWYYHTAPQKYANNASQIYHAGKALGGTSTINGMTYLRSENVQIDAWEDLGASGWNWASLYPYYKKSEQFQPPTPSQAAHGAAFNPEFHGFDGHVNVGWQYVAPQGENATAVVNETWNNAGMPYNIDVNGGLMRGFSVWPFTVNANKSIREDSARAYYYPVQERPNLHVYLNTTATKLIWDEEEEYGDDDSELAAKGVEVASSSGELTALMAQKEVVVSLGATRTPVFLECSGIGNPAILSQFSIPVRISSPTVGENLQDQTNAAIIAAPFANVTSNFPGYPPYVSYPTAADLFGSSLSSVESWVRASIPSFAALNVAAAHNSTTQATQERLLTMQADLVFGHATTLPIAEILTATYGDAGAFVLPAWGLLPFGRGSIHVAAPDPLAVTGRAGSPAIDPNFFMNPFDARVQVAATRLAREVLLTPPLAQSVAAVASPSLEDVPEDAGDDAWLAWNKQNYNSNAHPVGTAAMMARDLGGVVDAELRVYGTRNVRVVDASVIPWQVCGHLTSTIYALAERAADLIKKGDAA